MPIDFKINKLQDTKKILTALKVESLKSIPAFQSESLDKLMRGKNTRYVAKAKINVYALTDEEKLLIKDLGIPPFRPLSFNLRYQDLSFNPTLDKEYFDEISKDGKDVLLYYHFKSNGLENNLLIKLFY